MNNDPLTRQQKLYLIYLLETSEPQNLTTVANAFACSKVNAKKMIDRMIRLGVVYKEHNTILLTEIGRQMAEDLYEKRNDMAVVLHEGLGMEVQTSLDLGNVLLMEETMEMRNRLLRMARYFSHFEKRQGDGISSQEVRKILGPGTFKAFFVAFQNDERPQKDISVPVSMAQRAFEPELTIDLQNAGKEAIVFHSRPVHETVGGSGRKGRAKLATYYHGGQEYVVPIGDTCRLPFDLVQEWYYSGVGILQGCLEFYVAPTVDIAHRRMAWYVVTIHLLNLHD